MDVEFIAAKSLPSVIHKYKEWLAGQGKNCDVVATSLLQTGDWFNLIVTFKKAGFIGI